MIPVLLVVGLVLGRWWRTTLAVATILWPFLLVVNGVMNVTIELLGAAALAFANSLTGVIVHQGLLWTVRQRRVPT